MVVVDDDDDDDDSGGYHRSFIEQVVTVLTTLENVASIAVLGC